ESLQKAIRSLETDLSGLEEMDFSDHREDMNTHIRAQLSQQTPDRLRIVAQAFREGFSLKTIHGITSIDPWFLDQIEQIVMTEDQIKKAGLPTDMAEFLSVKMDGFSDGRLAQLANCSEHDVRAARQGLGVHPVYKRVDTCAAEFAAKTPYMYSTYEPASFAGMAACESKPSPRKKVIILGGGPNRIGQGIEFDYCCCHAAFALKEIDIESIMVNCNPETVSTDYDTSDRLYFEPLSEEDVLAIIAKEQENGELLGVIVQYGGQTPLKLAECLEENGIPLLGTKLDAIDLAEDRERFKALLEELDLKQPRNDIARTDAEAVIAATKVGYPVVLRPSFVLGGRAMEIVDSEQDLHRYVREAVKVSGKSPLLVDQYLRDAIEVDVDAICDGEHVFVAAVMEHIEEAGVHSGDSACSLPPYSLSDEIVKELKRQTKILALALGVVGLMNIQFAVKGNDIYLIEVNPRASRTVPFVAKATGLAVANIAAKVMAGHTLSEFDLTSRAQGQIAVKEAVFPFARFPGVDTVLGPEMRSTGEIMGLAPTFGMAFAKSQLGGGVILPRSGTAFISVKERDKPGVVDTAQNLINLGFTVIATSGTAKFLRQQGLDVTHVKKVSEGRPNIVDAMKNNEIALVFNTTWGKQSLKDSFSLRRAALENSVPYFTTAAG
ncbi:MAG TPA: carbamoyl-phosphate synthase large subunit, partial [Hellea balneolensis]|nr:carbamoyl-phosphate synthase large subunit [Hellea balneolensis]